MTTSIFLKFASSRRSLFIKISNALLNKSREREREREREKSGVGHFAKLRCTLGVLALDSRGTTCTSTCQVVPKLGSLTCALLSNTSESSESSDSLRLVRDAPPPSAKTISGSYFEPKMVWEIIVREQFLMEIVFGCSWRDLSRIS